MSHRLQPLSLVPVLLVMVVSGCAKISGKTVGSKDGPNILVATDGSICVVSKERFDKTEVGMKALCAWRGGRVPAGMEKN